jgi:hypothetical protein
LKHFPSHINHYNHYTPLLQLQEICTTPNLTKTYKSNHTKIINMSFLTRTAFRTTRFAPRAFSTSFAAQKTATETVKDAADTVNHKVADKIVDGIELGGMSPSRYPHLLQV